MAGDAGGLVGRRRGRAPAVLAVAITALALGAPPAGAGDEPDPEDQRIADAAVLTAADVPPDLQQGTFETADIPEGRVCRRARQAERQLEGQARAGVVFSQEPGVRQVSQEAVVFPRAKAARRYVNRTRDFGDCFLIAFEENLGQGITIVDSSVTEPDVDLGDQATALSARVVLQAPTGAMLELHVAIVIARVGRGATGVNIFETQTIPIPPPVAEVAVDRLSAEL